MDTPFFEALRHILAPMRSRSRPVLRQLRQATLCQLEVHLQAAFPAGFLSIPAAGDHSRKRIYSLPRTFWCWIWQILQSNTSCREVVRQVQALHCLEDLGRVDECTGGYCRARGRLPIELLHKAFEAGWRSAFQLASAPSRLLQARRMIVVDGSSVRLPDTPANRKVFPPTSNQFAKPTFPMVKILALFCGASGTLLQKAVGTSAQNDLRLLMDLAGHLKPGDIMVGDRAFSCFLLAAWLQGLGADLLARASLSRKIDFRKAVRRLDRNDAIFHWSKPKKVSPLLDLCAWLALPDEVSVRIIRARLPKKGFRTKEITLVTTLLDADLYPASEVLEAYFRRWRLEMTIDDLKTTLGMEMLSCQSPRMVEKELEIFFIAHNLLRWVMLKAALHHGVDIDRISFKGTLDAFRQWTIALAQAAGGPRSRKRHSLWVALLRVLALDLVPWRPGRREPRAVKKRSKYPPLSQPRGKFQDRYSRNKRRCLARRKKFPPSA